MNGLFPLWLKLAYTLYASITVAVYWFRYGPGNYLWFSDIALIFTVPALWLESPLLSSMLLISILIPEIVWNVSYFSGLATGRPLGSLAGYMFDRGKSRFLRGLSLFHIFLPLLLLWMVARLGYDPAALYWQTVLCWIVLPASFFFTDPAENINWVRGPGEQGQRRLPPLAWLGMMMLGFPLLVYLPTQLLLRLLFG